MQVTQSWTHGNRAQASYCNLPAAADCSCALTRCGGLTRRAKGRRPSRVSARLKCARIKCSRASEMQYTIYHNKARCWAPTASASNARWARSAQCLPRCIADSQCLPLDGKGQDTIFFGCYVLRITAAVSDRHTRAPGQPEGERLTVRTDSGGYEPPRAPTLARLLSDNIRQQPMP